MSILYMTVILGANFWQGAPKITIIRESATLYIICDNQWFYSKYKNNLHAGHLKQQFSKKKESNTKSNSLGFTGYKAIQIKSKTTACLFKNKRIVVNI